MNAVLAGAIALFWGGQADPPVKPTPPPRDFPERCMDSFSRVGKTLLRSAWDPVLSSCTLSIEPDDAYHLVYRSYLLDQTGLLMVFNSYGPGPDSTMTGARDYYFFPRKALPAYRYTESAGLEVRAASGGIFTIDFSKARLREYSQGKVLEDPEIRKENRGGVEIQVRDGLLLDAGFSIGSAPEGHPEGISEFRDRHGASCQLANSEIFELEGSGNVHLRFDTDSDLARFLSGRCPQLDLSSLQRN